MMKRLLAIALGISMGLSLAACGNQEKNSTAAETSAATEMSTPADTSATSEETSSEETTSTNNDTSGSTDDGTITGPYEINTDLSAAKLPDDAQEAFEKVHPGTVEGDMYVPIALLGRQVVSGTNYAILCYLHDGFAAAGQEDTLHVVTIYEDLDGNAGILSDELFDIATAAENTEMPDHDGEMVGGFEVNTEDDASRSIPEEVQNGLDTIENAGVHGIAVLGTQVVSGTNYAVLCLIQPDGEANPYYALVTVYVDLDGNAEYTIISPIDIGQYVNYSYNDPNDTAESTDTQG